MIDLFKLIIVLYIYFIFMIIASEIDSIQFLICKHCGHKISTTKDIVYVKSPYAIRTWNETLFDTNNDYLKEQSFKPDVYSPFYQTIQLVKNPLGNKFNLITLKKSDLLLLNETKSLQDTWFPKFKWIIGVCSHCLIHLGWYFESIENNQEGFFGLIVDKLINDNYADNLIL